MGNKAYLSAILDLCDKSIVSFVLGRTSNIEFVFKTFISHIKNTQMQNQSFTASVAINIHPLLKKKLDDTERIQSMSRVSRCIDNGPKGAFWRMLKSERYYLKKFTSYDELENEVNDYINYYNNHRYQKKLNCLTSL